MMSWRRVVPVGTGKNDHVDLQHASREANQAGILITADLVNHGPCTDGELVISTSSLSLGPPED